MDTHISQDGLLKRWIDAILGIFYPLFKRFMSYSVFAYLSLGAVNTVLNIALFAIFYQFVLAQPEYYVGGFSIKSYTISLIIAFVLTVPTGYWLAKNFAFKTENGEHNSQAFMKYVLVVLQGLVSDYILMKVMIELLDIHPTVSKVASTVIVLTVNYLLQKHFTFKDKKH
ncbi:GtrA family protein [Jiulongibacter sp. NS-SX5]|uniref:GtrA family protein n=1 Tax=Jiulongibacter sp. NS-SX5 TaxID=3463854 RepID=UPI004059F505